MTRWLALALISALSLSCGGKVTFSRGDKSWHYETYAQHVDAEVLLVIDKLDAKRIDTIQYAAARSEVMTGDMLDQIAPYELASMFSSFRQSSEYEDPPADKRAMTVQVKVTHFDFDETMARVTIRAIMHGSGAIGSFDREYTDHGSKMGHQVMFPSAAIRHSSLAAFQGLFDQLRRDLLVSLGEPPPVLPVE